MARKFFNQSVRVNKNTGRVTITRRIGSVTTTESYSAEEWKQKNSKPKKEKKIKEKQPKEVDINKLPKRVKNISIYLIIISILTLFRGFGIFVLPVSIYLYSISDNLNELWNGR